MKTIIFTTGLFIAVSGLLIFTGCSTSAQETNLQLNKDNKAGQSFSFYKNENDKDVRWDVNFDNGKISSVFKDGERIPDDEIDNYKDMIYDKLDNLQNKSHHITIDLSGIKSDMKKFKEDMNNMKEEFNSNEYFDNEDFKEGMKELSKELSKLKDKKIEIEFNTDKFRDEMEKLKHDINIHVHINKEALEKNIDKLNDEIQKHSNELSNIDIDLSGLDGVMSNIGKNMARVKINLDGLDSKLEKLNTFIDELKDEMIKDDLIQNKNEKLSLDLYKNGMEVNGKKVPEELFNKYKKMYKDYFDKELTDDNHFRIIE